MSLFARLLAALGDDEAIRRWLLTAQPALGDQPPMVLLQAGRWTELAAAVAALEPQPVQEGTPR